MKEETVDEQNNLLKSPGPQRTAECVDNPWWFVLCLGGKFIFHLLLFYINK